ncbi:pyruvate kinase [Spirulina major CS-329]|jgi:pyruvate kinase|uniref:pyruvate kinase n=1 Tax=Spirulina TaxID=1154 RepID=UPI00232D635D|nr:MULTISPECIES: pyruvate kinase [Spirulina]MDB9495964.1 pyruvate kinase [Spirulina subsalsa CS-330]MDB9502483.1 pyruvate kinase [Spirulina major CS-329]
MFLVPHRTKIVATIGPASRSPETIRHLIKAGMGVARLNFSHGSYDDHAVTIQTLRQVSQELHYPLVLLQDLQGPKIRVVQLPENVILTAGETVTLGNAADGVTIPIDYPSLAEEAIAGNRILLDDGKLELTVLSVENAIVTAQVIRGGTLKNRKGVNFPELALRLPSITDKDKQDLAFGLKHGIDWVALSFVRQTDDVQALKTLLTEQGASDVPVIAKIERPQAIDHLDELVHICDGIMVARGDLGVEMSPEKVPMLQKQIIHACNQQGIPVITATQMLESMITNAQPTRAEASDVANAIIDGTDAVMLSGESAVGDYPVEAVKMLGQIATEVEPMIEFINLPPAEHTATHALSEALNVVDKILNLRWIVAFTSTGYTAKLVAAERPKAPILALTTEPKVYTRLNVIWGVTPILMEGPVDSVEVLAHRIEEVFAQYELAEPGDQVLILGGSPVQMTQGTNFLKIHTVAGI